MNRSPLFGSLLMAVVFLPACGCDGRGPTVEVSGRVTLDGKAVPNGTVWFTSPRSGAGFSANLGQDGAYAARILDVSPGETYGVNIGGSEVVAGGKPVLDGSGLPRVVVPPVPAKYLEAATSGLTATVTGEAKQTFDFALTSK